MHSINKQTMCLFLLSLFFYSAFSQDSVTHCAQGETPLFSCTMHNEKILSLCSVEEHKFLTYRYGKHEQVEFTYPNELIDSEKVFSYRHYFRYRTDYFQLFFKNENYQYEVFRYYSDDGNSQEPLVAGVSVTNLSSGKDYINECKTIESDSISILRDFVPCDSDGDFGCK